MSTEAAANIGALVRARNRELAMEAIIELLLGVVFTVLTFGVIFVFGYFLGLVLGRNIGLTRLSIACVFTGVFFLAAVVSAWRRVDPLAGVDPMTFEQQVLTEISLASPNMLYFSPRHASAGLAMLILGGPENLFSALGTWRHRLDDSRTTIEQAAGVLTASARGLDLERLDAPHGALLLRRLALIKITYRDEHAILVPTERGREVL